MEKSPSLGNKWQSLCKYTLYNSTDYKNALKDSFVLCSTWVCDDDDERISHSPVVYRWHQNIIQTALKNSFKWIKLQIQLWALTDTSTDETSTASAKMVIYRATLREELQRDWLWSWGSDGEDESDSQLNSIGRFPGQGLDEARTRGLVKWYRSRFYKHA